LFGLPYLSFIQVPPGVVQKVEFSAHDLEHVAMGDIESVDGHGGFSQSQLLLQ
jgi:hypothetical protein